MTVYRQFDALKFMTGLARQSSEFLFAPGDTRPFSLRRWLDGAVAKRGFDVCFSLSVLLLFSPLYLVIALIIKLTSPGPVFYVQRRVGKDFRPFGCIKFRTMVINADAVLEEMLRRSPELRAEFEQDFKLKKDPRITGIGHILRLTSLDEFPQFWNVLKGDMSIVGPRPLVPKELYKYGRHIDKVLTIRPGLTGLWQVSGRNDIPYHTRVRMDSYYVHHRHCLMDLWIVCKTVIVMLFPKDNGAY
ncbi:sugar transferase [Synechococcus moorigangaii CMS01]|nr:sugar transferase [Synechococcus moorigangaii CMS01]